jgi:ectoine hydroxylase-related dioxygenase (phytanoyl-CoA dioxygenase family)
VLGEDTYVYSHKMTMKQPRTGGAWEWHQDYGYWYQNRCLVPEMTSIWIALDPSHADNGCLQVLEGSHRIGRLDHLRVNDQTVVDAEYLDAAVARFELSYVEMEPGDALVFHCNLLHRSDANRSDGPRWGYIVSYNTAANRPFRDVRDYGRYEELRPVPAGSFRDAAPPVG